MVGKGIKVMDDLLAIMTMVKDYHLEVCKQMNHYSYGVTILCFDFVQNTARWAPPSKRVGDYAELGLTSAMPL